MAYIFTNKEINIYFASNREICRRDIFFNISRAEAKSRWPQIGKMIARWQHLRDNTGEHGTRASLYSECNDSSRVVTDTLNVATPVWKYSGKAV